MNKRFLPGLPVDLIQAAYTAAPGNELESGKFHSPDSSAALVANAFGFFLNRPTDLTHLPGGDDWDWPAASVGLEAIVRFPWRGGRHPCLDVLVETRTTLIGIESKRYEPFRSKPEAKLSEAYWRPVWGDKMAGYERVRDGLRDRSIRFSRLDAGQLIKHAFGLRTAVHSRESLSGKQPVLYYLYAEPERWGDGKPTSRADIEAHRDEVARFTGFVSGDEVRFLSCTYRELLKGWSISPNTELRTHAAAILECFCL